MKTFIVIRLRGNIGLAPEVLDTLNRMNMPTKHSATLVIDTPSYKGMLNKVTDYVTWGEIDQPTLEALIAKRGRLAGDNRITTEVLKKESLGSIKEIAERALADGEMPEKIKKTFRLTPPSGGYKRSIKRHVGSGGELGYRGAVINELILKMI
jgi:large subunit ribosomal protein L30